MEYLIEKILVKFQSFFTVTFIVLIFSFLISFLYSMGKLNALGYNLNELGASALKIFDSDRFAFLFWLLFPLPFILDFVNLNLLSKKEEKEIKSDKKTSYNFVESPFLFWACLLTLATFFIWVIYSKYNNSGFSFNFYLLSTIAILWTYLSYRFRQKPFALRFNIGLIAAFLAMFIVSLSFRDIVSESFDLITNNNQYVVKGFLNNNVSNFTIIAILAAVIYSLSIFFQRKIANIFTALIIIIIVGVFYIASYYEGLRSATELYNKSNPYNKIFYFTDDETKPVPVSIITNLDDKILIFSDCKISLISSDSIFKQEFFIQVRENKNNSIAKTSESSCIEKLANQRNNIGLY